MKEGMFFPVQGEKKKKKRQDLILYFLKVISALTLKDGVLSLERRLFKYSSKTKQTNHTLICYHSNDLMLEITR